MAKRYNLMLPDELSKELQQLAEQRHTTVIQLLRQFIKLGLLVIQAETTPNTAFILRTGETEQRILFL